jgi:hypothetical protein
VLTVFRKMEANPVLTERKNKPRPEHIAQICLRGHLVLGSLKSFPQFAQPFCEDCGDATISECQTCHWPIRGLGPNSWMVGGGQYRPPKFCGECGKPFPWTEMALAAAKEYTDGIDQLSVEEKAMLKRDFDDLVSETPRTPVATSRWKKFMGKIGPAAGAVLQKTLESVLTDAVKKTLGL